MIWDIGRARGKAQITVDEARCTACGLCARVCKGGALTIEQGRLQIDLDRILGCVACGHCMAVCPQNCITVEGRDLYPEDVLPRPSTSAPASYDHLYATLLSRRSVREYRAQDVDPQVLDRLLDAAATAPMGLPPSEVRVLVVHGQSKVRAFRDDLLAEMRRWRWLFSPLTLALLRPLMDRDEHALLKSFVRPALNALIDQDRQGGDWFFYGAPLALYFYAPSYADPADPVIAATYAMLAGETLGLGSCMLGFPGMIFQYSKRLKDRYRLPRRIQPGMALILGYPAIHYQRVLKRRLGDVRFV